jgi:hypothetical protein
MLRVFVKLKGAFMLLKSLFLAAGIFVVSQTANAQFGLPSIPGLTSGSSSAPTADANTVLVNANRALTGFINAEAKIAQALGAYNLSQEQKDFLKRMGKGDVAPTSEDLDIKFTIQKAMQDDIDKKIEQAQKLDPAQKKLALEGGIEYLKALLSSKNLVSSVQGLASNPVAAASNIGALTTLATNLPGMVTKAATSTTTMIKYFAANGIDTSQMKKEADSLGK